jgi:methyl-accepting chemotaxis protein
MTIGSAYKNAEGVNVISASGILKDNSDRIRVISADMTLDRISIIVNSFIEMDDAQTFLVDKNSGTILADRDSSLISQKLGASGQSSFYQDMAQRINDQNYDFTTIDGEMTVSQEVQGTDWILVSYIPKSTVLADLVALRTRMIVIGVICIILLCVLIERMTHVVVKPVKEMTNVITQMASGDFTVSVNPRGNDEIAVMGYSVQHFIESMKQMITQIGQVSQILSEQAQSSKSVSTELNSATEIQSRSMGELNSTVDQLAVSVNEIAENATQLAGVAADTKKDSDVVDVKMRETVEVSEKGRQDMEKVSKALEGIELSIHNLQEAVDKVGTASGEIVDITNLIGSIAEETNLLSLNASIEAARAGEAGRGFAVVASEISQMAQQTKDSTVQISQLIENVSNAIQMVVEVSGSMISMIESQNETTEKTAESFTVIEKNSDNVYGQSNELAAYVTKLANANKKIIDSISTISAISEEVAAHASDTLSATESNNVIVEELAALSGQLETLAQELKEQ